MARDSIRAMAVNTPAALETNPLRAVEVERPRPLAGELLVPVRVYGVCRTHLYAFMTGAPMRSA